MNLLYILHRSCVRETATRLRFQGNEWKLWVCQTRRRDIERMLYSQ